MARGSDDVLLRQLREDAPEVKPRYEERLVGLRQFAVAPLAPALVVGDGLLRRVVAQPLGDASQVVGLGAQATAGHEASLPYLT